MCKSIRLHLALECRAPQRRIRQMEMVKCDVNFKDIWKIVMIIHTTTFWIFLLSNFRLVLNVSNLKALTATAILSSTGYTINAKTPNMSCLLSKLLLCCAHVKEIEFELTKIFNLILCFALIYMNNRENILQWVYIDAAEIWPAYPMPTRT